MDSKFLATIGLHGGSPNRLKTGLPSHSELPHKTEALLGLAPLNSSPPGQATSSDGKPPASKQLHQAKWSG